MNKLTSLLVLLFLTAKSFGQVFWGIGSLINDDKSRNRFPITVTGLSNSIDSKFGIASVTVNITHSHVADLDLFLISPDQTLIELSTGNGGDGQDYTSCLFSNNSGVKIANAKAPFKGSYKPEGSMGVMNNYQNPNGTWWLVIVDTKPGRDSGQLLSWNVVFSAKPCKLEPFVNSSLPLILINTFGQSILDDPRIYASMRIVNNVSSPNQVSDSSKFFNYGITIETRGSSSQSFPKKPYGFSTVLKNQADTDVSLLGLPAEHDWVLNATYDDKSLMRDVLAYELARRMGRYATRYRYCELFVNGKYEGIYILMEKVKRDKNRVDITKLELKDSTGNALTGGYIVKIDKTTGDDHGGWTDTFPLQLGYPSSGNVYFQFDYPNGEDMVKKQRDYIASAIYKFENALASSTFNSPTKGYRQYADESTFIDLSIINEISKNVDGYRLSTYMYKDRDSKGGKLKMGPVWDYNLAFNNADYNNSSDPTGWEIDLSYGCPFWWKRFRQDTGYVNAYYCRWSQLRRSAFSLHNINKFVDSLYDMLEEASYRNLQRWPVMGIYVWPNPLPLSYSVREEVDSMKSWIQKRVEWMDATLAIGCKTVQTCAPRIGVFADKRTICKGQSVKLFADGVGATFKWSPSKGLNTISGREVIASPDATTTYKVVMKTAKGCGDSAYITITVLPLPSKTISGKPFFCQGNSTDLSVPGGYRTYQWSPATGLDNTSGSQVKASHSSNLTYKVVITDSLGCKDSSTVTVLVYKNPEVRISASRDSICAMDSVTLVASGAYIYKWLPAQGLLDSSGNMVTVFPMNTTYTVIGQSDKGCLDTASYSVFSFPPRPLSIEASATQLCYGAGTLLIAGNGSNFNWQKTTGFDGATNMDIRVFPKTSTRYRVSGMDIHGCQDSAGINIEVYPEVQLQLSGDTGICSGDKTILNASGANTYDWSPGTGLNTSSGTEVTASPQNTSKYRVIGASVEQCTDTAYVEVVVYKLPVLQVWASSLKIEEGEKDTIWVSGASMYAWTADTSLNTDTGNMVIVSPLASTVYKVKGTDGHLCSASDSIFINVTKKQQNSVSTFVMPDFLIHPNPTSDLVTIESPVEAQLIIYSIQGSEVYRSGIAKGSNQFQSRFLGAGVYVFCLQTSEGSSYYKVVVE